MVVLRERRRGEEEGEEALLNHLAEAAAEHAKVLKKLYDDMEEQQAKITQLVDDNRWLRRRVRELEARLGEQ